MKKLVTVLMGGAFTLAFGVTAQASENDVAFSYNPEAPASVTMQSLRTQAKKVCDMELGPLKHYGANSCIDDYVGQIVEKIDRRDLTALYMSKDEKPVLLAELKSTDHQK